MNAIYEYEPEPHHFSGGNGSTGISPEVSEFLHMLEVIADHTTADNGSDED